MQLVRNKLRSIKRLLPKPLFCLLYGDYPLEGFWQSLPIGLQSMAVSVGRWYLKSFTARRRSHQYIHNVCITTPFRASIYHWADWSISQLGFIGRLDQQPKVIFVQSNSTTLNEFLDFFLPRIAKTTSFVLVTAGADETIPDQVDQRFPGYELTGLTKRLENLHDDPRILAWYVHNLDRYLPKMIPLPVGYWEGNGTPMLRKCMRNDHGSDLSRRPLKALCNHRIRGGAQWEKRKLVTDLAVRKWSRFVDCIEDIPKTQYASMIRNYSFVLCVQGGGLDPSPKAWVAILNGCIPIIEASPTADGYIGLPVATIERWEPDSLNAERLLEWRKELAPYFEDPQLRRSVLNKLSLGYWLDKIHSHID
jgi:hypothetical protein